MRQLLSRSKGGGRTQSTLPFWLILPTIIVLLAIQVYPALYTVWLSLQEREPEGWTFIGLENFKRLFATSLFNESVGHTIVFLVGYAGLTLVLGFVIALLLSRNVRLSGLYITLLFIPWIIADLLVGLIFRLMVVPDYGLLSGILQNPAIIPPDGLSVLTAVPPKSWFGDFPFPPAAAMTFLILASTWRALPFVTLLLLAAMQTVPTEIIESSRIDGANGRQVIRHIMVPLMLPTMVVALFSLTLSGMNGVGMVFSLTGGGPGTSTYVLSYMLYSIGWDRLQFGRAAALALMIAIVNWLLISGTLRLTRVEERSV
ncbi:MAG: sugar ABC transporter permease [Ardenticatenaceae bacterium]|nr:sugar ABC transporter permease [Anaerolineales bacterium]MCB8921618.1 sugar ABC transporter permease [Ardenticatenaceae bacterium]MCB9003349.1 sugar ABC transporter permease [Ardenticatenaceae bacterium]